MKATAQLELEGMKLQMQGSMESQKLDMQTKTEGAKLQMQDEHENKKLNQQKEIETKKINMERDAENEADVPKVMPHFEKLVKTFVSALEELSKQQQKFQKELVSEMQKPKVVKLGAVQRSGGEIVGANVTVQ
jgi:F0F1-type ATP synthase membrane subunit b/b'